MTDDTLMAAMVFADSHYEDNVDAAFGLMVRRPSVLQRVDLRKMTRNSRTILQSLGRTEIMCPQAPSSASRDSDECYMDARRSAVRNQPFLMEKLASQAYHGKATLGPSTYAGEKGRGSGHD